MDDFQKQAELLRKLTEENAILKQERTDDANHMEKQRKLLVQQLEEVLSKPITSEELLENLVEQIEALNDHISKLGTTYLEELISPGTIFALVASGFFRGKIPGTPISCFGMQDTFGMQEFARRILSLTPPLSIDQQATVKTIVQKHTTEMERIANERKAINTKIEAYFNLQNRHSSGGSPIVIQDLVSMTAVLECLRKNLDDEAQAWDSTIQEMLSFLSPQQKATMILQAEYRHASLQQLKYLWGAIYGPTV